MESQGQPPVGLLIWVMIIPMLLKIDSAHSAGEGARQGIGVTLVINWLVKPFSMASSLVFIRHCFALLPAGQDRQLHRGPDLLPPRHAPRWCSSGAGSPRHAVLHAVAGSAERLIMIFAFAPLVGFLLGVGQHHVRGPRSSPRGAVHRDSRHPAPAVRRSLLRKGGAFDAAMARIGPWSIAALSDTGLLLRLPGQGDPGAAVHHRAAGGADPDHGVPNSSLPTAQPAVGESTNVALSSAL